MMHALTIALSLIVANLAVSPAAAARLSVLTYNVKGLPWPIAADRRADFDRIAARLNRLRATGRHPRVVALQEAFTDEARAIGAAAGYRFRVDGPDARARTRWAMSRPSDRAFAARADWLKGEGLGKLVGSGLQILSDYPVLAVKRMAFPAFACAGFDCLANKGVLLVVLAVPGSATPVTVVTTHLNSRRSSGVPDARSLHGYRVQVAALARFLAVHADQRLPLVLAGDFNVGKAIPRQAALFGSASFTRPANDALRTCANLGIDAREAMRRARDWQFFKGGSEGAIAARAIETPFGRERDGTMLSDHIGYTAHYALRATPLLLARRERGRRLV